MSEAEATILFGLGCYAYGLFVSWTIWGPRRRSRTNPWYGKEA